MRGGTATRSTSLTVPAYRAATAVHEVPHGGREDGDRGDHLVQGHQGVAGVGLCGAFNNEPAEFLAVEPDLDPDACLRRLVEFGRHTVVKRPVKVRQ